MTLRLLKHVPLFYWELREAEAIFNTETQELDQIDADTLDLLDQFFIDTATWGLPAWERAFGIPVDPSRETAWRRSLLKTRVRGLGVLNDQRMREILGAYDDSIDYDVNDPRYILTFIMPERIISRNDSYYTVEEFRVGYRIASKLKPAAVNLNEFNKEVCELMPAHLLLDYRFKMPPHKVVVSDKVEVKSASKISANSITFITTPTADLTTYRSVGAFKVGDEIAESIEEVML